MGSGASAKVQQIVDEVGPPAVTDALTKLSLDDRAKFWDTVEAHGVESAVKDSNAEVKAAFAQVQPGNIPKLCAEIEKVCKAAPTGAYLKAAYDLYSDFTAKVYDNTFKGGADQQKLLEEEKRVIKKFDELIRASFAKHDRDESGTLSRNEASVFFEIMVSENAQFQKLVRASLEKQFLDKLLVEMKEVHATNSIEKGAKAEESAVKVVQLQEKKIQAHIDQENAKRDKAMVEYLANKRERDEAAFKLCDAKGDGELQLLNILHIITPGTKNNIQFLQALGVYVEPISPPVSLGPDTEIDRVAVAT